MSKRFYHDRHEATLHKRLRFGYSYVILYIEFLVADSIAQSGRSNMPDAKRRNPIPCRAKVDQEKAEASILMSVG